MSGSGFGTKKSLLRLIRIRLGQAESRAETDLESAIGFHVRDTLSRASHPIVFAWLPALLSQPNLRHCSCFSLLYASKR